MKTKVKYKLTLINITANQIKVSLFVKLQYTYNKPVIQMKELYKLYTKYTGLPILYGGAVSIG